MLQGERKNGIGLINLDTFCHPYAARLETGRRNGVRLRLTMYSEGMQEPYGEPDVPSALVCVLLAAHLASSSSRPSYRYDIEVAARQISNTRIGTSELKFWEAPFPCFALSSRG